MPSLRLTAHTRPSTFQPSSARKGVIHGNVLQSCFCARTARSPSPTSASSSTGSNSPMLTRPMVKKDIVPVESRREPSMIPTDQIG